MDTKHSQYEFASRWPLSAWPIMLLCCSGGLVKIVYAVGYGYGLSMIAQGFLAYRQRSSFRGAWPPAALYVAYGARLFIFLFRREHSHAYGQSTKVQEFRARMAEMSLTANMKATMFVSMIMVATLYTLDAICASRGATGRFGKACLLLGTLGLAVESIADEQKFYAKAFAPDMPVTSGLYSFVRHPNYLGEILFWAGVLGMCVTGGAPLLRKAVCCIGPAFMIWVMRGAAARLDADSLQRYAQVPGYPAYAETTPSLFPFLI